MDHYNTFIYFLGPSLGISMDYVSLSLFCFRCPVTMDVNINILTKRAKEKDPTLKTHPCTVVIKGSHSHSVQSASALNELKVLPSTRDIFFSHFDLGMLYLFIVTVKVLII